MSFGDDCGGEDTFEGGEGGREGGVEGAPQLDAGAAGRDRQG